MDRSGSKLPVAQLLPEFVTLSPPHQRAKREAVTLRMLLAHSSGLPAYEKLFEFAQNRQELLRAAMTTPLATAPGTRADYSDIGFILLGEILERIAGEPLDQFVQREIFDRLGLTRTWFIPPLDMRPQIPPTEDDRTFRKRVDPRRGQRRKCLGDGRRQRPCRRVRLSP